MFLEELILENSPHDFVRNWAFTKRQIIELKEMSKPDAIKKLKKILKINGKKIVGIGYDFTGEMLIQYYNVYYKSEN